MVTGVSPQLFSGGVTHCLGVFSIEVDPHLGHRVSFREGIMKNLYRIKIIRTITAIVIVIENQSKLALSLALKVLSNS